MGKEESPQISRRTTRLSSCSTPNLKAPVEASKATSKLQSLSVDDLVFHGECISLDELINSFPGRQTQILELINLLGPLDSPLVPTFIYGGASTGKTSIVLQIFKHLNRPSFTLAVSPVIIPDTV
ncbi:UNVERIFIED_CONTAM: Origin of replication complex subunit [Sesamum radiatum]|uniref:Origin of replication complex subunit n=1 Tax=Sesamum radiatum TaxID=300843 RepID=A0AAW2VI50_SESRA